jgi:hypothetical protein
MFGAVTKSKFYSFRVLKRRMEDFAQCRMQPLTILFHDTIDVTATMWV